MDDYRPIFAVDLPHGANTASKKPTRTFLKLALSLVLRQHINRKSRHTRQITALQFLESATFEKYRNVRPQHRIWISLDDETDVVGAHVAPPAGANIVSKNRGHVGTDKSLSLAGHGELDKYTGFKLEVSIAIFPTLRPIVEPFSGHQLGSEACHGAIIAIVTNIFTSIRANAIKSRS